MDVKEKLKTSSKGIVSLDQTTIQHPIPKVRVKVDSTDHLKSQLTETEKEDTASSISDIQLITTKAQLEDETPVDNESILELHQPRDDEEDCTSSSTLSQEDNSEQEEEEEDRERGMYRQDLATRRARVRQGPTTGYGYNLVDKTLLKEESLKCPICLLIPRVPAKVDCCGYIFCQTCISLRTPREVRTLQFAHFAMHHLSHGLLTSYLNARLTISKSTASTKRKAAGGLVNFAMPRSI